MNTYNRNLLVLTVVLVALLSGMELASAQTPFRPPSINPLNNAINRPTVSPYLNLLQRNGNGLPTYQTLVRPQIEQRQAELRNAAAIQQLQYQASRPTNEGKSTGESGQVRGTGHVSGFMNHMHFFNFAR